MCDVLSILSEAAYRTAADGGFWDHCGSPLGLASKVALIHSECTELLEEIRKDGGGEPHRIHEELADILIRTLDLAGHYGGGDMLGEAVIRKMRVNRGRAHKHGKRF